MSLGLKGLKGRLIVFAAAEIAREIEKTEKAKTKQSAKPSSAATVSIVTLLLLRMWKQYS